MAFLIVSKLGRAAMVALMSLPYSAAPLCMNGSKGAGLSFFVLILLYTVRRPAREACWFGVSLVVMLLVDPILAISFQSLRAA